MKEKFEKFEKKEKSVETIEADKEDKDFTLEKPTTETSLDKEEEEAVTAEIKKMLEKVSERKGVEGNNEGQDIEGKKDVLELLKRLEDNIGKDKKGLIAEAVVDARVKLQEIGANLDKVDNLSEGMQTRVHICAGLIDTFEKEVKDQREAFPENEEYFEEREEQIEKLKKYIIKGEKTMLKPLLERVKLEKSDKKLISNISTAFLGKKKGKKFYKKDNVGGKGFGSYVQGVS
ncbi:MAG: hypothetical protein U9R00_02185 [Patescibacteria group bacterium]|nr:hypothetical protein [Patescibacteria group bacterium]